MRQPSKRGHARSGLARGPDRAKCGAAEPSAPGSAATPGILRHSRRAAPKSKPSRSRSSSTFPRIPDATRRRADRFGLCVRYAQIPHLRTEAVIVDLGGLTRNGPPRRAVPKTRLADGVRSSGVRGVRALGALRRVAGHLRAFIERPKAAAGDPSVMHKQIPGDRVLRNAGGGSLPDEAAHLRAVRACK